MAGSNHFSGGGTTKVEGKPILSSPLLNGAKMFTTTWGHGVCQRKTSFLGEGKPQAAQ